MTPLQTSQRMLKWFCILPPDESTSKIQATIHSVFALLNCASVICVIAASFSYFWKFVQTDLSESLYAIYQVAAFIPLMNGLSVTFLQRRNITNIFVKLSEIYEKGISIELRK